MKSRLLGAVSASLFTLGLFTSVNAALVDNGGGLIYDDVLDITWAQPDVRRNWADANTWASGLSLGGVSGWRLPYISVAAGAGWSSNAVSCNTATEVACRDNELGYMFYQNLSGTFRQSILTSGDPDLALFPSLQSNGYWSGTDFGPDFAWLFYFDVGDMDAGGFKFSIYYSWAVHSGDVSAATNLVAAVLPASRSVQVGNAATAFATVINTLPTVASSCGIARLTSVPASFSYQTTDPATNALVGTPNTPVDIVSGGLQTYVFAFTPTFPFGPTDVELTFDCFNTNPAPVTTGLNTLLLSASNTPVPDIVALAATPTGDGILDLPGTNGSNAFAVATVNVGSTGTITATATPSATLPLVLSICETNPATGACLSAPVSSATSSVAGGGTPTYSVFVTATGTVPFDPANNRIFVRFEDAGGVTRGATSVAVRTL